MARSRQIARPPTSRTRARVSLASSTGWRYALANRSLAITGRSHQRSWVTRCTALARTRHHGHRARGVSVPVRPASEAGRAVPLRRPGATAPSRARRRPPWSCHQRPATAILGPPAGTRSSHGCVSCRGLWQAGALAWLAAKTGRCGRRVAPVCQRPSGPAQSASPSRRSSYDVIRLWPPGEPQRRACVPGVRLLRRPHAVDRGGGSARTAAERAGTTAALLPARQPAGWGRRRPPCSGWPSRRPAASPAARAPAALARSCPAHRHGQRRGSPLDRRRPWAPCAPSSPRRGSAAP